MGLTIEKLLFEYMTKEQVQDGLRDIGKATSGTKDELVERLKTNWKSYNRDVYDLLDFVDNEHLQMICYYYNLDASDASEEVFIRRIKKAEIFEKIKKNSNRKDDNLKKNTNLGNDKSIVKMKELSHEIILSDHKISRKMMIWTIIGTIATLIGVIVSLVFALK